METLISVIQKRTHKTLDITATNTLASFFEDPTPEKHIQQALTNFQLFFERISSTPLSHLISKIRDCLDLIARDKDLRASFDDFFALARRNLMEPGYMRSEEAKERQTGLQDQWKDLVEKGSDKWRTCIGEVKTELAKIQEGMKRDQDLENLKVAHVQLARDLETGLVDVAEKAKTDLDSLLERATWFWQDLIKVYIPHFLGFLSHFPVPRCVCALLEILGLN